MTNKKTPQQKSKAQRRKTEREAKAAAKKLAAAKEKFDQASDGASSAFSELEQAQEDAKPPVAETKPIAKKKKAVRTIDDYHMWVSIHGAPQIKLTSDEARVAWITANLSE